MTTATEIRDFLSGIDISSYFEERRTAEEMRSALAALDAGLNALEPFTNGFIGSQVPDLLISSNTALTQLERYTTEADAAERARLAESAIFEADAALVAITTQIQIEKNVSSPEAVAYGVGALHYAVLVRQFVADTVQDGPLGAPGLYEQITAATTLMYDEILPDSGGEGLFVAINNRINRDIDVINIQGDTSQSISFTIVSDLSEIVENIEIQRAQGQSDEEFNAVVNFLTEQQLDIVFFDEQANAGIRFMQEVGEVQNEFLPGDADDVPGVYERIGTDEANTEEGTELAEYFQGLGGDDLLNGKGGPDALSGGAGNDILRGGSFRDMLVGGEGNDLIFGSEMRSGDAAIAPDGDTARFFGLAEDYSILGGVDYAVVTGPDGSRDKLFDVSFLRFDDGDIALNPGSALDREGDFAKLDKTNFITAERVALLYEAALDRNGAIDLPGLNFYIGVTARDNLTDEFLAADLMTSPEFTEKFGDVEMMSNTDFLSRIYENVLDRTPDAEGLQFYLDLLDAGTISRALALADISVSPENTQGSTEILMSLYETTAPVFDEPSGIDIAWSFVA